MSPAPVVDVWLVPVDVGAAGDPALLAFLGPGERAALDHLGFAADRDRAVTSRAVARQVLGERLGMAPDRVPLQTQGRPRLLTRGPSVSWSHSGRWVALAIGGDRAVGIDIERVPPQIPVRALGRLGVSSLGEFVALEAASKATDCDLGGRWPPGIRCCRLAAPEGYLAEVAAPGDDWGAEVHFRCTARPGASLQPVPAMLNHPIFSFGPLRPTKGI